jgi:hypothetical protein
MVTSPSQRGYFRTVVAGRDLDRTTIDQMWDLRARIFQLKSSPEPAVQRSGFEQRLRIGQRNLLLWDRMEDLHGMVSMHWRHSPDGRQLWVFPEYVFTNREVRGSTLIATVMLEEVARLLLVARGRTVWFAGLCYPRSFQTIARMFPATWTLADPGLPPDARAVLHYHHETFAGEAWDRERHWVRLPTIPEPRPKSARCRSPHWLRYEQICPHWQEGFGVGVTAQIGMNSLVHLARDGITRALRDRRS